MKKHVILISIFLFLSLPTAAVAAESASEPGAGDQRAACDAGCRDNYQNNAAGLQACLRDCGAVGPASPGGAMAPAHEAAHTVQQATKGKPTKEQFSSRPATPPPIPSEASNLNLSKSNINRVASPSGGEAPTTEATTVKSSKSNSSDRMAAPITPPPPPPPVEGTTVKGSKSNSSERQASPDTGETPPAEPEDDPPADG